MRSVALLLLLVAVPPVRADAVASVRRDLVTDLEDLADWCTSSRLLKSRNHIYELLLGIEPDHEKARYWLRYERLGDRWARPRPYREPQDRNPAAEAGFAKRRAAVAARLEQRLWPLVDQGGPERAGALALILALDPAHERARTANGEIKWHDRWVLRETRLTYARRAELQKLAGEAVRAAGTAGGVAHGERARPGPRLDHRAPGAVVAVRGHRAGPRRGAAVAALRRRGGLVRGRSDPRRDAPPDPRGHEREERRHLRQGRPRRGHAVPRDHRGFSAADRKVSARLGGPGCRAPATGRSGGSPRGRRDGSCRAAVGVTLGARYGRFKAGWIIEGFGLYFTHSLVGTRLTTFVARTKYASSEDRTRKLELLQRMYDPDADWLALARGTGRPDLRFLATKGLNEMTEEDLLWSFALATYLVEGRPDGLSRFLASSVGNNLDVALDEAYGMGVPELESRLVRWLGEVR